VFLGRLLNHESISSCKAFNSGFHDSLIMFPIPTLKQLQRIISADHAAYASVSGLGDDESNRPLRDPFVARAAWIAAFARSDNLFSM
jgi:hypothetical protein